MLLADRLGRRLEGQPCGGLRAAGLVFKSAVVLAANRLAPAQLADDLAGIAAARRMLDQAAWR